LLLAQGHPAEARSQLDPLIVAARDPKGGLGSALASALLLSSRIAIADRRGADADNAAKEALSIAERNARQPEHSADVGEALLRLAQARRAENDAPGLRDAAARAVVALTNSLGADHPLTREALALSST
jgi:hypothetical protein